MTTAIPLLSASTWQCVHFVGSAELDGLRSAASQAGLQVSEALVRGEPSKESLLGGIAEAMHFPGYFGGNWDALEECLRDLEWLPVRGYVLVVRDASSLWRLITPTLGTLVEVWLSCAEMWSKAGVPFHLVFVL